MVTVPNVTVMVGGFVVTFLRAFFFLFIATVIHNSVGEMGRLELVAQPRPGCGSVLYNAP